MVPALVQGGEILLIVKRKTANLFRFVVINSNPEGGLQHHEVTADSGGGPKLKFRTAMVLDDIDQKQALDDVFWMALFNLSISQGENDTERLYDILLPFMTGKNLEESMVDAHDASGIAKGTNKIGKKVAGGGATDGTTGKTGTTGTTAVRGGEGGETKGDDKSQATTGAGEGGPQGGEQTKKAKEKKEKGPNDVFGAYGDWRSPQRSQTSYVRCLLDAVHYLLRSGQVESQDCKVVGVALRTQFIEFIKRDLAQVGGKERGERKREEQRGETSREKRRDERFSPMTCTLLPSHCSNEEKRWCVCVCVCVCVGRSTNSVFCLLSSVFLASIIL